MPRRLAAGTASDLVQAERDIRGRIGDQKLDFAAMAAVSNIYRAAEAGVTKGTLTGVLKTLEKRGLVRRRAHESDGRLVLVSLESKGVGVIERLFPAFNMGEAFVSASLSVQEKEQLASLLRTIIRSVEEN